MSDKFVTVAAFSESVQAELARGRLESDGIPAIVTGGMAATAFSGIGNLGGRIELSVAAEHHARAVRILAECGAADHLNVEADDEGPVWICPLCGDPVRAVLPICPACHTPRGQTPAVDPTDAGDDEPEEGVQTQPSSRPGKKGAEERLTKREEVAPGPSQGSEPGPEVETEIELPPLATMVGDAMARRSFYAALFGLPSGGLLVLYSIWVLAGLALYRGELSARGMRYMYGALLLDGALLLAIFLYCGGLL